MSRYLMITLFCLTSEGGRSAACHSASPPSYLKTDPAHLWTRSSPSSMNSTLSVLPVSGLRHPVSFHRPDSVKPLPIWTKSGRRLSFLPSSLQKPWKTTTTLYSSPGISGTDCIFSAEMNGQFCLLRPFFGRPACLYSIKVCPRNIKRLL